MGLVGCNFVLMKSLLTAKKNGLYNIISFVSNFQTFGILS